MKYYLCVAVLLIWAPPANAAYLLGVAAPHDSMSGEYLPTELFRLALDGSSYQSLGQLQDGGVAGDYDAIAASPTYGLRAFSGGTGGGSRLVRVNEQSVTATVLSPPLFGREIRGAAFDDNERLWALDVLSDELVEFSPQTGIELRSVGLSLDGSNFDMARAVDLAVDFSGQMLLVHGTAVFDVDLSTGALTERFSDTQNEASTGSPPLLAGAAIGFNGTESLIGLDVAGGAEDDFYAYDLENSFQRTLLLGSQSAIDFEVGDLTLVEEPVSTGDYNSDGVVNLADYTAWRNSLGSTTNLAANGNDSGTSMNVIDEADYLVWKNNFGAIAAIKATSQAVPEPNVYSLVLLGFAAITLRRIW